VKAYHSINSINDIEYNFPEQLVNRVQKFIHDYLEEHSDEEFYNIEVIYDADTEQYSLCPTFVKRKN